MKQDIKLLATDLDGTLLKSDKTVSEYSLSKIHQMINQGHFFVISTGRPFHRVEAIINQLKIKSNKNYCICFNGGLICTTDGSKIIYECLLKTEDVVRLVDLAEQLNISTMVYLKDVILVDHIPEVMSGLKTLSCIKIVKEGKSFLRKQVNVYKILYIGTPDEIKKVKSLIPSAYYEMYNLFNSSDTCLEITPKSVDKGKGIIKLAEYLDIDINNTIAVGDQGNDLPMIKTAKLGCAVSNGNKELISCADYITKSNDEDGVAYVINQFILKENN